MKSSKDGPAAHFEVDDAEAAFHKLEDFTRKILAIPKRTGPKGGKSGHRPANRKRK